MLALIRIFALFASAVAQYISFTAPTPPASAKTSDAVHKTQLYDHFIASIGTFSKVLFL